MGYYLNVGSMGASLASFSFRKRENFIKNENYWVKENM